MFQIIYGQKFFSSPAFVKTRSDLHQFIFKSWRIFSEGYSYSWETRSRTESLPRAKDPFTCAFYLSRLRIYPTFYNFHSSLHSSTFCMPSSIGAYQNNTFWFNDCNWMSETSHTLYVNTCLFMSVKYHK